MVLYKKKHSAAAEYNQPKPLQGNLSLTSYRSAKISTVLGKREYCCCLQETKELHKPWNQ